MTTLSKYKLQLADGTNFRGQSPKGQQPATGEVVFNTGMVGYVETLTDPSYAGQIVVFTYPLIGNYGVPSPETWESTKIHATGVVVSGLYDGSLPAHAKQSFATWLDEQHIPWISGIDTRALTKYLRTRGTIAGRLQPARRSNAEPIVATSPRITIDKPKVYNGHCPKTVLVIDCGAKENIIRMLRALPVRVKRVPLGYDISQEQYDGVLVSNGPGDPTAYPEVIATLKACLRSNKPVFGICLGSQLMGLAAGAKTYKLPFGHRGHNQPCIDSHNQAIITSQNHGYAIDETTLPKTWQVTHRNLNDNSVEGIAHKTKPFFSVQFHPEAAPGPTDTTNMFERFRALL